MTDAERLSLQTEYALLAAYYGASIDDLVLAMYVEDLEDLPLQAVLDAMGHLRRQGKRRTYPLPGDIRDAVQAHKGDGSDEAEAQGIAGRICESIGRFGYTGTARAQEHIGPIGWTVIERMGGWVTLCQTLTTRELGTFRAQCRDQARALLETQPKAGSPPARLQAGRLLAVGPCAKVSPQTQQKPSRRPHHARIRAV